MYRVLSGPAVTAAASGNDGAWRLEAAVPGERIAPVLSRLVDPPEAEAVESAHPFRPLNQDAVWVHRSFVGAGATAACPAITQQVTNDDCP